MDKRIKMIISLVLALLISSFINQNIIYEEKPVLDTVKLETAFSEVGVSAKLLVENFRQIVSVKKVEENKQIAGGTGKIEGPIGLIPIEEKQIEPTSSKGKPIINFFPTRKPTIRPTIRPTVTQQVKTPTPIKKPTTAPTAYAPQEDIRSGQDLEEIFEIASDYSCTPVAVIKAIVAQETPGIFTMSPRQVLLYNSYKWWYRVETREEICSGQAYHPGVGLIPKDSNFAGERCKEDQGFVSTSIGAGMIIDSTWNSFKSEVKSKLRVKEVDRRVLLDAMTGVGLILNDAVGSSSCRSWDIKTLKKAACIYYQGVECTKATAFYCNVVCNNYNKYSGDNLNCSVCYTGNN